MSQFFASVWDFLLNLWNYFLDFLQSINILTNLLDILLVAFAIYSLMKLVRDSRAEQLLKGILVLILIYFTASVLHLQTLHYLLRTIFDNGLIVLIIIFQPEIRRALEQAGLSKIGSMNLFSGGDSAEELRKHWQRTIGAVCGAVEVLQQQRMGALIVFERNTKLGEIINTGTVVNADATQDLIINLFFQKTPLHDGAMILRDARIHAAGCILPLSELPISRELGTRHRAAVGMSENSDAVVVVLSEETGTISIALGGDLKRNYSIEALRVALENTILIDKPRQNGDGDMKTGRLFRKKKNKTE